MKPQNYVSEDVESQLYPIVEDCFNVVFTASVHPYSNPNSMVKELLVPEELLIIFDIPYVLSYPHFLNAGPGPLASHVTSFCHLSVMVALSRDFT